MLSVSELVIFEFSHGKLFTVIEQDSGIVKKTSLYCLLQNNIWNLFSSCLLEATSGFVPFLEQLSLP